jgi:hypothetical protein
MREPRDPDEPQLIVESLRPQADGPRTSTSPGLQWRTVSRGLWVVLALLIVVAASVYLHTMPIVPSSPSPSGLPGVGWTHAGPAWARTIVFAASAPATAYTCGTSIHPEAELPEAISVGVSHDGGHTWQALDTPAQGVACEVSVNPTDARDVMLNTNPCSGCVPFERGLYRFFDAGSHWRVWPLPPRVPDGRQDFAGYL